MVNFMELTENDEEGLTRTSQLYAVSTEVYRSNSSNFSDGSSASNCDKFLLQYNVIPSVICAFLFVFGVLYTFFGYRLLKATLFVTGFIFGCSIVYFVCIEEDVLPLAGKIGVSLGAGFICGLVAMLVLYVGLFMTGFHCGLLVGLQLLVVVEFFYHPFTRWLPIGVCVGVGIVFAILILIWQRNLLLLSTSLLGSGLILLAVDYFLDVFRMTEYCYDRLTARQSRVSLCWFSWLVVAVWPALALLGLVVQACVTASGYDHRPSAHPRHSDVLASGRQTSKNGLESDQNHYRHLYQIRRVNGDVISKSYIKRIEEAHHSPSLQLLHQTTDDVEAVHTASDNTVVVTSEDDSFAITNVQDLDSSSNAQSTSALRL